jgi:hypothetical protein
MDKVTCTTCKFENNKRCIKKNVKVKLNKKRICNIYEQDDEKTKLMAEKILSTPKPVVTMRPDWYWDRKKYIKEVSQELKKEQIKKQRSIFTSDPKHPLTGNLSKFVKSTASKGE